MIEQAFELYALHKQPHQLVADLIAQIRPAKPHQVDLAVKSLQSLSYMLNNDAEKARLLREAILKLLSEHKPISLFSVARHSVFSGFFTEMWRRISHKILPEAINNDYLIDLFAILFTKKTDAEWVSAIPDKIWTQLILALSFEDSPPDLTVFCRHNLLSATQVLSYRIAALGLEPELLRSHPKLEQHSSPFIIQNEELDLFLPSTFKQYSEPSTTSISHILVMLDQCTEIITKIRRNSAQTGTSIRLTYLLQRIAQNIARLETLLNILNSPHEYDQEPNAEASLLLNANILKVRLFKELVYSECHKNDLNEHWQENMEIMALRVTENASRTGEHYITENLSEYFELMRSAMGAGVLIGFMGMIKIMVAEQHLASLTETILFALNYGLGFILIHILHFTVATKQPAMTAAAIAASIDETDNKSKEMDNLVDIVAKAMRSQVVAIFGNVVIAIPTAILIAWAIFNFSGQQFISTDQANHLLADINPIQSAALFYAAVAGVCLFLSGLIAGYYDNLAIYNKIPQRLRALKWLQTLLGVSRLARVANYIENNLGALAGNFYFGCLLAGMSEIGVLFGLPFDIRHIAFSSVYVGFSAFALDFQFTWQMITYAGLGILLIGMMNLMVSFGLALFVAMKSRKIRFKQWRLFMRNLGSRLNQKPGEFIMPPQKVILSIGELNPETVIEKPSHG